MKKNCHCTNFNFCSSACISTPSKLSFGEVLTVRGHKVGNLRNMSYNVVYISYRILVSIMTLEFVGF